MGALCLNTRFKVTAIKNRDLPNEQDTYFLGHAGLYRYRKAQHLLLFLWTFVWVLVSNPRALYRLSLWSTKRLPPGPSFFCLFLEFINRRKLIAKYLFIGIP